MMLKSFRLVSIMLAIVLVFAAAAGMPVYADKGSGGEKGQLGSDRGQSQDRIQPEDKGECGMNCIRNEECDGTPVRDMIRLGINWDTTELPDDVLLQLDNQLITLEELEEKLGNAAANKNKNADGEVIKQLECERLKFREMLKNYLEDEVPDDELDEWIRQCLMNRESHRLIFRQSDVE